MLDEPEGNGAVTVERIERIVAALDVETLEKEKDSKGGDCEAVAMRFKAKRKSVVEALKVKLKAAWRRECSDVDSSLYTVFVQSTRMWARRTAKSTARRSKRRIM